LHTSCALFYFVTGRRIYRNVDSFGRGHSIFRSLYEREIDGQLWFLNLCNRPFNWEETHCFLLSAKSIASN
jgi:hypothetical protein